jgi:HK97 family phage major capsid protein
MSTELKQAIDDLHSNFEEFKKINKAANDELAKKSYIDPLLKSQQDKLNEAISKAEEAKEAAEKAQLEIKKQREVSNNSKGDLSESDLKLKNALVKYVRGGINNIDGEEKNILVDHSKAMSVMVGAEGGYAVTPQVETRILEKIRLTSPIRQYADVITISTDRIEFPAEGDDFESAWVGETEARPETATGTFTSIGIDIFEQYAQPAVTQKLLDDAYFDIEAYVTRKIADKLGREENKAFFTGDGIKKPRGLLTYPTGTNNGQIEQIVSGGASTITPGGLINLIFALPDAYQAGAVFMMNKTTVQAIRMLKDTEDRYIWSPGFGGQPSTLFEFPVVRASDMPAVTSNALAIAFGNFREGYLIVDRTGIRVLRDPYTRKGFVRIYTTKRVGGGVKNFDAIKLMKISA